MMPRAKMASTGLLLLQFMLILGITSGQNDFQSDAFDVDPTRYENADYEFQSGHKLYNMDDSFLPGSVGERARRIPPIVEPIEYFIRIQPYFPNDVVPVTGEKNMTFDGICTFVFKVMNATDSVTLHSFYLTYSNIKLLNDNGKELINNARWSFNETLNHIIIQTGNNLRVGNKYMLQFKYNGKIHNYTETGLYYTAYLDKPNGTAHFMLATHMEPARARWVFPCLDEPAYKAYFHITLIYPKGLVALANTMERPAVPWPEEGWEVIQFPPSLKMSTYLVAFAIGPYVNAHTVNEDGTLVRIWGWTGQEDYLTFAVDVAAKCLHTLGVYLNYPYPYIKSDQLGLPEFVAGAMENYGLIIYKYQFVAIHPKDSTTDARQAAAKVICHELAHQWFGDTVTAMWWDDLFLQEGFAAFFERFNMRMAIPQQEPYILTKWLTQRIQPSLRLDAIIKRSHPLYAYNGPEFDLITYGKGASVLRMIYSVLGADNFRSSLQAYIKKYQFSNADHEMLFAEFTAHSKNVSDWCGRPIDASLFLNPWFLQQGFPLVTVTNNQLMAPASFSQQPFNEFKLLPPSDFNYSWPIPFIYSDYKNSYKVRNETLKWIKPAYEQQCPPRAHVRAVHWNMGNAGSHAHLRVQYDDIGFARLMQRLRKHRDEDFKMQDQMELIGDQLALLRKKMDAGEHFSYKNLIAVLKAIIPNSPHFGAFEMARLILPTLERIFMDGPDYVLFQRFIRRLLEENYKELTYKRTSDSWDENIARYNMMPYMVRYEVGNALSDGYQIFQQFITNCSRAKFGIEECSSVDPDVRKAVYCAGSRMGSAQDFKTMHTLFENQAYYNMYFYGEYFAMLEGMACTNRPEDIDIVIELALREYKYRYALLFYVVSNRMGSERMAQYLLNHKDVVLNSVNLDEYLDAMTSTWYSELRLKQLEDLQSQCGPLTEQQQALFERYLNRTRSNVEWWNKYYPDLSRVFYDAFVIGPFDMENWNTRVPRNFKPFSYNVKIRPNFPGSAAYPWYKNMTFDGEVEMRFTVLNNVNEIQLNSHRMVVEKWNMKLTEQSTKRSYEIDDVVKDLEYAFLTLKTQAPLTAGSNWTLWIKYTGFVWGVPSKGVYTNTNYFEFNNKKAWIFSTYFESGPSARSLVPCFDEPDYKARWQMTLEHPADMIALGNMPDQGFTIQADGWARTSFLPTPPMSSYLLAIASGHFASLEGVSETGVLVRLWSWTGMEIYAGTALKVVSSQVDFMSTYFMFPYPLPKLDMLALPQYTTMKGAEEHWGFIHIAYKRALVDPLYADAFTYSDVSRVTAHETVHQWFGDLVTIKFWPVIFLNEAFANYWETFGVERAFPTQSKYNKFERYRKALAAYEIDSYANTSKPVVPDKPKYFTRIPYNKGASLLHMLSNTIRPGVLQHGLQSYLQKYQYSNTNYTDLWSEITEAARAAKLLDWDGQPLDVEKLMDTWILQATYPVLKVMNNAGTVTYAQEPFIQDTSALQPSPYNFIWIIPVFSQTSENTTFHYFVGRDGSNPFWTRPLGSGWQVENPAFKGYFRVWYDDDTWKPILAQLKSNPLVFDELTRAQFIADAIALQQRGSVTWSRVLDLLMTLKNEKELAPWYAAKPTLDLLLNMFRNTTKSSTIQKFIGSLVAERYTALGWKKQDDWSYDMLAHYVTEWACEVNHADCRQRASTLLKQFVKTCAHSKSGTGRCNSVAPEMRLTQYCWGTQMNADIPDVVAKMYRWFETNSKYFVRDTLNLLEGQTCTTNEARMNALIADALTGKLPSEVVTYIGKRDTEKHLWNYFVAHPDEVKYGVVDTVEYMSSAMAYWNSEDDIDEAEQFLTTPEGQMMSEDDQSAIKSAIKEVRNRVEWLSVNTDPIGKWLTDNVQLFFE